MDVGEWQKRLEDNFSIDGVVGGNLLAIIEREKAYGDYFINKFHGQSLLLDSFQSFFIETLRAAPEWINRNGWPVECPSYSVVYGSFLVIFRSIRACENTFLRGYPFDAYALLRDVKDRAIFLGGVANKITTLSALLGLKAGNQMTQENWNDFRKEAEREERKVLNRMLRNESGIPPDIIDELRQWEYLFNTEVHGSKLTFASELGDWLRGLDPILHIGPVPKDASMAVYMNRIVEIGWMIVRLLPYLQPVENAFGQRWREKQLVLDDSFKYAVAGLGELGKKIAEAFTYFIDFKYSFPVNFHYFEVIGQS